MTKQQKLLVGKQLHDGLVSIEQCMEEHSISRKTAYTWLENYEVSAGLREPKSPSKPLGVPAAANPPEYEAMGKEELIRELMRKEIEVARLKKGYSVKGGGSKKEYVTSSGSSTK